MTSYTMSKDERETFLAQLHVAILSVAEAGRGPLTIPVWYAYQPGGDITILTAKKSRKGNLLEQVDRFSLCVQTETPPYQYVSVEGPIVARQGVDVERDLRPLARRYLGIEGGDQFVEDAGGNDDLLIRMHPERWLSVDYSKGS